MAFFKLPSFKIGPLRLGFHHHKAENVRPPQAQGLKLVFFIIDWDRLKMLNRIFEEEKVHFHFMTKGRGTANSTILDTLGLGATDKAVIICLENAAAAPVIMEKARKKLGRGSQGAGIAFSVPLSAINTAALRVLNTNRGEAMGKNEKGEALKTEIKNELVITIMNQGYTDDFMTVAREAGARGGTIINARGTAHSGTVKFFGISVQDEKEIVIILSSRENKLPLMQALSKSFGVTTKAAGVVFSLPVDAVTGLNLK